MFVCYLTINCDTGQHLQFAMFSQRNLAPPCTPETRETSVFQIISMVSFLFFPKVMAQKLQGEFKLKDYRNYPEISCGSIHKV